MSVMWYFVDCLLRLPHVCCRQSEYGGVVFGGWARMAQTIVSFSIVEVAKPNIGENWPARVRADVTLNLNVQNHIKSEWEGWTAFLLCTFTYIIVIC